MPLTFAKKNPYLLPIPFPIGSHVQEAPRQLNTLTVGCRNCLNYDFLIILIPLMFEMNKNLNQPPL